jgi:hypothetical protein
MPTHPHHNSASYWADLAAEARIAAERMRDDDTRSTMLRIAERYENLAKRATTYPPRET